MDLLEQFGEIIESTEDQWTWLPDHDLPSEGDVKMLNKWEDSMTLDDLK